MNHESRIKLRVFLILIPLIFLAAGCDQKKPEDPTHEILFGSGTVTIAGHELNVEIAQTIKAQEKGLGGRDSLGENVGMLFVFSNPDRIAFWMKDTRIPLDFIWIKDSRVVEITPNVPTEPNVPDASLHIYQPAEPIDSTIEVNAGWTTKNQIKVGDPVKIDVKP